MRKRVTSPQMPESSDNGNRAQGKSGGSSTPLWRAAFDALERPVARASESWMQSDTFMDAFALTWRVQRRVQTEVWRGLDLWIGAWRVPTRRDVDRISNEIASLERQVRALRAELEAGSSPPLQLRGTPRRRPSTRGRR